MSPVANLIGSYDSLNEDVPDLGPSRVVKPVALRTVARQLGRMVAFASSPSAGSDTVQPPEGWGSDGSFDRWRLIWTRYPQYVQPRKRWYVWIDPAFHSQPINDPLIKNAYDAIRFYCLCVHRVCGVAFTEVPWASASIRYRFGAPGTIYDLSYQWQSYGAPGVGGVYYAMKRGHSEIWLGTKTKQDLSKPVGLINMVRIAGYSTGYVLGSWGLQDQYSPIWAMRNPNLSGPLRFPSVNGHIATLGLAGHDWPEINAFQTFAGSGWVWRQERGI